MKSLVTGCAGFIGSHLSERLLEEGHEVHVVTFGTPSYEERDGYFVHRQDFPSLPKFLAFPWRIVKASFLCFKVIKKYDLDLIYAQEYISGLMGMIVKKLTGRPMYYKYVGDWAWEASFSRGWTEKSLHEFYNQESPNIYASVMMFLQRKIARNSKTIIAPSNYLKSILARWAPGTPVKVIPNAIEFHPCDRGKAREELGLGSTTLLSVGRLVPYKGFQLVLESLKGLEEDFSYYIIGDGPYKKDLERQAKSYGIGGKVRFLGALPKNEVREYLCASDLFILPSYYEGMSHVILEAMSSETPVLASDIPPNRELISEGKNGFLVEHNPDKIKGLYSPFSSS